MWFLIRGSNVSMDRSFTRTPNQRWVVRTTQRKNQLSAWRRPTLFFDFFFKFDSSISTNRPGPPNLASMRSMSSVHTSLQKLNQSTNVISLTPTISIAFMVAMSLHHQYISCKSLFNGSSLLLQKRIGSYTQFLLTFWRWTTPPFFLLIHVLSSLHFGYSMGFGRSPWSIPVPQVSCQWKPKTKMWGF